MARRMFTNFNKTFVVASVLALFALNSFAAGISPVYAQDSTACPVTIDGFHASCADRTSDYGQSRMLPDASKEYVFNPREDSLMIVKMKAYIADIRKERPAVALVLSGGGAKGAAHVGVIDYIDSLGIPVDIVLGTSMGGLVGSLYSLGYTASDMDNILKDIDWSVALTDRVPRDYSSFSLKKYKEKILLSFPFYYKRNAHNGAKTKCFQRRSSGKFDENHLGGGQSDATSVVRDNLIGSLPSGFAYGQNVNNILSSLTVGYQDEMSFTDLPVPFICVATEMVSGRAKLWGEGKLNTALRSTMSIPGVFAPVKTDGMVLVDGGMRDNYPTDIAKQLGADIIIGVDLAEGFRGYEDLNNLGDIIAQGVDMLGRASYETNMNLADVTIKPNLPEFNMMSFDKKSIATIVQRGHEAAEQQAEALDSIRTLFDGYSRTLRAPKAVDLNSKSVMISKIEILGVTDNESRYLMRKIGIKPGESLDKSDIEEAVSIIMGTSAFDYVTYELQGKGEPYGLLIHCRKGPIHQFGIGGRFDTEEIVSILLNLGFNVHVLQGSAVNIYAKVSANPYAKVHYYLNNPKGPTLNVTASFKWTDHNRFMFGEGDYNMKFTSLKEEIYFSNIKWQKFDLNVGARSEFFKLNSVMTNKVTGDYDLSNLINNYLSLFGNLTAETFDDSYFPTRGFSFGLGYEWVFKGLRDKIEPVHVLEFNLKGAYQPVDYFAIIPSVSLRYLLGGDPPLPYINLIGGSIVGRYMEQQIPFIGINYASTMQNFLTIFRSDFRFRLFKNNYLTAIANYAVAVPELSEIGDLEATKGIFGVGLRYSYNSIVGPVEFDLHCSTRKKFGAYLGIGLYF